MCIVRKGEKKVGLAVLQQPSLSKEVSAWLSGFEDSPAVLGAKNPTLSGPETSVKSG